MKALWALFALGLGAGLAVVIGQEMDETAMIIAISVMSGLVFGVFPAIVDYRCGVRAVKEQMRLMYESVPRQEPAPAPPMFTLDPSLFARPAPQPRGGLVNNGSIRTMPADMYQ